MFVPETQDCRFGKVLVTLHSSLKPGLVVFMSLCVTSFFISPHMSDRSTWNSEGCQGRKGQHCCYFMYVEPVGMGSGCAVLGVPGDSIENDLPWWLSRHLHMVKASSNLTSLFLLQPHAEPQEMKHSPLLCDAQTASLLFCLGCTLWLVRREMVRNGRREAGGLASPSFQPSTYSAWVVAAVTWAAKV